MYRSACDVARFSTTCTKGFFSPRDIHKVKIGIDMTLYCETVKSSCIMLEDTGFSETAWQCVCVQASDQMRQKRIFRLICSPLCARAREYLGIRIPDPQEKKGHVDSNELEIDIACMAVLCTMIAVLTDLKLLSRSMLCPVWQI